MCALAFLLKAGVSMTHFRGDFNRDRDVKMSSLIAAHANCPRIFRYFCTIGIFFSNIIIFYIMLVYIYIYIYIERERERERAIEIENCEGW